MIYGAINEKGERYYTRMSKVFEAIHQKQCEYNWLISDVDHVPSKIDALYGEKHYCWISGDELKSFKKRTGNGIGEYYLALTKVSRYQKF